MGSTSQNIIPGKLFVGGLSPSTTQGNLRTYFEKYGDVIDCVLMKDKLTGKSRGFGFVTFLQPEISLELLSKEHTIDGKEVDCKRAIPKEQIPNLASTSFKTKKLFVGGLPHHISKENFYNYFKTYGNIIDYVLINDKDTGRSRGFGFITFEHEDSLQKVIKDYNSHQILGKWVGLIL
eukprot:TRINITY_DN6751_c0_g1_i2.p1 TRINITY_DN6751_c0_g1~~TRINITY_DN6751_c0_g1_i2.p1  ORF type:complete len:178 (+),score=26.78 TRINITY_DN6751_c0_g1_i2:217-750(+)